MKYAVGYNATPEEIQFFSPVNKAKLKRAINEALAGKAVVTDRVVADACAHVLRTMSIVHPGDPYSRCLAGHQPLFAADTLERLNSAVRNTVVAQVRNDIDIEQSRLGYSGWNAVYGAFNAAGLQAYSDSDIKLNLRGYQGTSSIEPRY